MQRELQRYLQMNRVVQVIYLDRIGILTQRKLKLCSIEGEWLKAYCYTRRAVRTFAVERILAVLPAVLRRAV